MVLGLASPRLMYECCRDDFLSGLRKHGHDRPHGLHMLIAPRHDLMVSCHSIRILPQVKMEIPVLRLRKHLFLCLDCETQIADNLSVSLDHQLSGVCSRLH